MTLFSGSCFSRVDKSYIVDSLAFCLEKVLFFFGGGTLSH